MKKTTSIISISLLALLSACCQNDESTANKLFVEGALKANSAIEEYEKLNVKEALVLLEDALANCDKILSEYPQTKVALSLVSDNNLNFGTQRYIDLNVELKNMKAFSSYVDSYGVVGELLYGKDLAITKEAFRYFYDWREPKYKKASNISKKQLEHFGASDFKQEPILVKFEKPKSPELSLIEEKDIGDIASFSRNLKTNVSLIAYEKDAMQNLYKMSEGIMNSSEIVAIFEESMPKIQENIAKITLLDQRQEAFLLLSKIYANMNKPMAVNIAMSNIKDEELLSQAFVYYADKLIEQGRLDNAKDLLSFVRVESVKDDIIIEIAKQLKNISPVPAFELLKQCKDEERRNDLIVETCATWLNEANIEALSSILAGVIDVSRDNHLKALGLRLNLIYKKDLQDKEYTYVKARFLGELAVLFSPYNKALSEKFLLEMIGATSKVSDLEERADAFLSFLDSYMSASLDAELLIFTQSKSNQDLIANAKSKEDLQKTYLKLFVYYTLNEEVSFAQAYMDMLDIASVPVEYLIVALLKANMTKAEILKVIKG